MAKKTKLPTYTWIVLAIAILIGVMILTSGAGNLAKFAAPKSILGGYCNGAAICPINTTQAKCLSLGCNWTVTNISTYCAGKPKPCSSYTTSTTCVAAPNCYWITSIGGINATNRTNISIAKTNITGITP